VFIVSIMIEQDNKMWVFVNLRIKGDTRYYIFYQDGWKSNQSGGPWVDNELNECIEMYRKNPNWKELTGPELDNFKVEHL
jgi:hypothetical protein